MSQQNSLIGSLFDFSFSHFVTMKIIPILYGIIMVLVALASLVFAFSGFASNFFAGLLTLILAPVFFFFYVVVSRIWLEFVVVVFRIAENTRPRSSGQIIETPEDTAEA